MAADAATTVVAAISSPHSLLLKKHSNPLQNLAFFSSPTPKPKIFSSISCTTTHAPATHAGAPPPPYRHDMFNFTASPAGLPESVLLKAQSELFDFRSSSMSIMEMSHLDKEFDFVIKKAESDLRLLISISDGYSILFPQGNVATQFATVSLNICSSTDVPTDFVVTGSWGDKAYKEAVLQAQPHLDQKSDKYTVVMPFDEIRQSPNARYLHICANETTHRAEFKNYPNLKNKVL